ncbi:linear amide C-N hydrolase [Candidatus Fermentibacteria bacterium]|nr:linear amide C-N hydrolase [Candidatus Fermentibacteria bacterium]
MKRSILPLVLAFALAPEPCVGCTSFAFGDSARIVAKNYDWNVGVGLVIVNQRGVEKPFSLAPVPGSPTWTSRYGSVTFTQYGRDLPQGGMNEQGLVVEVLWLEGTSYPPDDDRLDIGCSQWVQYALDTAATVAEARGVLDSVQIRSTVPLHFFVADRHGDAASLEFLKGAEIGHCGADMPVQVLTNTPYATALVYHRARMDGSVEEEPDDSGSQNRFVRAATMIQGYAGSGDPVDYAFQILEAVAHPEFTQWSIVYDQTGRTVYFRTREMPTRRVVVMDCIDFTCTTPVAMMSVDAPPGDHGVEWRPYTREANLDLIRRAYAATPFLSSLSDSIRAMVASYPDRSRCMQ